MDSLISKTCAKVICIGLRLFSQPLNDGGLTTIYRIVFDKVAGVNITKAELSKVYHSSGSSSSSSSSSSSDDWEDDDLDKAIDASKKMIDAATKAAKATNTKSVKKALDAYEEALDALDNWDD